MESFFGWLAVNAIAAAAFTGVLVLVFACLAAVLVIAVYQGRELSFWPPKIGPRPPGPAGNGARTAASFTHDIFLSSPMAAYDSDEEYRRDREAMQHIIERLQDECRYTVAYAGKDIRATSDFDAPDISIEADLKALEASEFFMMLYPRKLVSSVLVEAGIAIGLRKPSVYFVRAREELPFLLRYAEQALDFVKIYETATPGEVSNLICRNRRNLFEGIVNQVPASTGSG